MYIVYCIVFDVTYIYIQLIRANVTIFVNNLLRYSVYSSLPPHGLSYLHHNYPKMFLINIIIIIFISEDYISFY